MFMSQPQAKRQQIWTAAGYPGQVPETPEEQRAVMQYQHNLRMKEISAMYPPERFAGNGRGRNSEEQLYYANVDRITDNVRAEYSSVIQAAATAGDYDRVTQLQRQMRQDIQRAIAELPKPASLKALEPGPRWGDTIDDYLASLTHDKLQTLIRNIANPRFRQELEQEEGVDSSAIFARLHQAGFLGTKAPAPQPTPRSGIPPLVETDRNRIRERFNRDPQLRQFSGR
jgi:hypothetical protein